MDSIDPISIAELDCPIFVHHMGFTRRSVKENEDSVKKSGSAEASNRIGKAPR